MTTMVKVAKLAGVSISTVSHVLNGTRHVNDETRQRVLKAIEDTSYRQDALLLAIDEAKIAVASVVVSFEPESQHWYMAAAPELAGGLANKLEASL